MENPGPGRPKSRFMGAAQDARKIARALVENEEIKSPKKRNMSINDLARKYADATILIGIFRLEKLLKRDEIPAKEAIQILTALRDFAEWVRKIRAVDHEIRQKRARGRPKKEKKPKATLDELDAELGIQTELPEAAEIPKEA